ncbi:MAG: AAA family ATPase, partial [Firmicutes bacterium]|nr:AAA family ATPase [Bacillota bacterium]
MAKKAQTVFVCQECGYESPKWMGQCICGAWNSFVEEKVVPEPAADVRRRTASGVLEGRAPKPVRIGEVQSSQATRIDTGIGELNRVLGGGLVQGSIALITGEPGIGKSTIIIQAAASIAQKEGTVLYVSGEESEEQIKMRADRVCKGDLSNLYLLAETNMENVLEAVSELHPAFLIFVPIGIGLNLLTNALGFAAGKKQGPMKQAYHMINLSGFNIGSFTLPFVQTFLGAQGVVAVCLFDTGNSVMCTGGTYALASEVAASGDRRSLGSFLKNLFSSVPLDVYLIMLILSLLHVRMPL